MVKMPTFIMIAYFRDRISAKNPLYRHPNQAPSSKMDVNHPFLVWSVTQTPISTTRVSTDFNGIAEHTLSEGCHREHAREDSLVVAIHEPVRKSAIRCQDVFVAEAMLYPPKHAKHAMPNTRPFLTRAAGPEAPVRA